MLNSSPRLAPSLTHLFQLVVVISMLAGYGRAQGDSTNVRFTQGQVNESATMSLSVPIATFPGRGLDLPISLSYSSAVWRIDHMTAVRNYIVAPPPYYTKQSVTQALYAEHSKAGWKSALDLPRIEWPKQDEIYSYDGRPATSGWNYRIPRVTIHMPDGSVVEFRKSDRFYISPEIDMTGTFWAVDGSRMRFDSTGVDTGTLFMPDGTRYVLGHPNSYVIDRHGNTQTYNEETREWTDVLGRVTANPIPAVPEARDYTYSIPGIGGATRTYIFKWRHLAEALTPVGGSTPSLRNVASHYLPNPFATPSDSNAGNFPRAQSGNQSLFQTASPPTDTEPDIPPYPGPVLVVGAGQSGGQLFDPVVLAEIVLPDATTYKFSYNVYGEINKVVYPTGAFEEYEYDPMISMLDEQKQPYVQATRKVRSKRLSVDGSGGDIAEWKYGENHSTLGFRRTFIVAPDKTRTETLKWDLPDPIDNRGKKYWPFGQTPSRNGKVFETRQYSRSVDGMGGELLRRDLTQYEESTHTYTYTAPGINPPFTKTVSAYRNARPNKSVSLIFEGNGPALAAGETFSYDTTHEFSTGVDQTVSSSYHYAVISNTPIDSSGTTPAKDAPIEQIPLGTLARYSETSYLHDEVYRSQNILALATSTRLKTASGTVVSQSEIVYDECPEYCATPGRGSATSMRVWDSTKGAVTNPGAYLATHAKFDGYGNQIEAIDAKGFITTTVYDPTHQAFPIQSISAVPDPTGQRGSSSPFTTSTVYDATTGLALTTTDINGQMTTFEYDDPLLRTTRVIAPNGRQTITEYGAGTSASTRWARVRTQIDETKWSEATSRYDGVGRTYLTEKQDSDGDVFTETEFDVMGRVKRSTNPYRSGEAKQWTTPQYDDLGRTTKVVSPDGDDIGMIYGLSTGGVIGTTKTVVDQTGRERSGISDALGNMTRVYEGPVAINLFTDYVFDTAGNLRRTVQGEQSRYFLYDSLGRILFSKQPELDVNPLFAATDPVTNNSAWSTKFTYDNNSNITTTTDSRNIAITGTYDRLNRLVSRDYSDSTPDVNFFYDGTGLGPVPNFSNGKTTKISSTVSETRNTSFDLMGRLLSSEQRTTAEQIAGTEAPYTFSYAYNLSGAVVEQTYPTGRVVRQTLNADGELSQVRSRKTSSQGFATYAASFSYNSSGALLKMQLGNGRWESAEYDPKRMQVTMMGLGVTPDTQNLFRLEFGYNSDGQLDNNGALRLQRIIVPAAGNTPSFTAVQSYYYDFLNRLSSAEETVQGVQTWKQTFDYDRYGNRRFNAYGTTTLNDCAPSVCNPTINTSNNRFSAGQGYSYDSGGSVTRDAGGQRFNYDAENHQKEFFTAANQTSTPDATYHYDGQNRRVKKIVGSEVTIFVYDALGRLAAEYSTTVASAQDAKVSYLMADHLGSSRVITDQYGRVVSRKDFAAFGDEIITPQRVGGAGGNGYDPPNIRQDYTGYERDAESDLEFAQARYYSSSHGRFTSVDPMTASATIKNPQTFNRYSYVINSPYQFVDPLGLALVDIGVLQTTDPYLARYAENHSTYQQQRAVRQLPPDRSPATPMPQPPQTPEFLRKFAGANPRSVTSDDTGEFVGTMTLTPAEVAARIALADESYAAGFADGVRQVQRETGENMDVTGVSSTNGSQATNSSAGSTSASITGGSSGVSGTVGTSSTTGKSDTESGSLTATATVNSGVGAAAADSARLASMRQNIINAESSVLRDVQGRDGLIKMRVDPTKFLDQVIKHGLLLGRADGRLSYDRTRILQ
jgi:RHS repeat-associated protein